MSALIFHILSTDIPHHNHTMLRFFTQQLLPYFTENHRVYIVSQEALTTQYPQLNLCVFPTKKAIAQALIRQAKMQPQAKFIFYGQFNFWIWIAIFIKKLPAYRCYWHIWGADLYEEAKGWKAKIAYWLRRKAQNQLPEFWGTEGDLHFAQQHLKRSAQRDQLLYFPTPILHLENKIKNMAQGREFTILLGNSGDPSNRHLEALAKIHQQFGQQVKLIIPMSYPANNHAYIAKVKAEAVKFFPENAVTILTEKLSLQEYSHLLAHCDLGYFNFKRQQGIGTICLLLAQKIPVALSPENPFIMDMQKNHIPFLTGNFDQQAVKEVKAKLQTFDVNQIAFFPPNYGAKWQALFAKLNEE